MTKIAIVSGGFDPVHVGHVELINQASAVVSHDGGGVIVILNTDEFLTRKKGQPFMPFFERQIILENLKISQLTKTIPWEKPSSHLQN